MHILNIYTKNAIFSAYNNLTCCIACEELKFNELNEVFENLTAGQ